MLATPGQRTRWNTPLLRMTQNDQYRQSPRNSKRKRSLHFPEGRSITRRESLRPPHEQSPKNSGRMRERLADAHGRPAATSTSSCRRRDHAPAAGLLFSSTASIAALISFVVSGTVHFPSMDFTAGSNTVAAYTSSILPHTYPDLTGNVLRRRRDPDTSSSPGSRVET